MAALVVADEVCPVIGFPESGIIGHHRSGDASARLTMGTLVFTSPLRLARHPSYQLVAGVWYFGRYRSGAIRDGVLLAVEPGAVA